MRIQHAVALVPVGLWGAFYSYPRIKRAVGESSNAELSLLLTTLFVCLWFFFGKCRNPFFRSPKLRLGRLFSCRAILSFGAYAYVSMPSVHSVEAWKQALLVSQQIIRSLLIVALPFVVLCTVPRMSTIKEYVKETPLYRRLAVTGQRGGSARFGGVYTFRKYDWSSM